MNKNILGGHHLVVPGETGEFAAEDIFGEVMQEVLHHRGQYSPRQYFEETWDTESVLESYLEFFVKNGWRY